jgi:hypothetical protein
MTSSVAEEKLRGMADAAAETAKGLKDVMEHAKSLFTETNTAMEDTPAAADAANAALDGVASAAKIASAGLKAFGEYALKMAGKTTAGGDGSATMDGGAQTQAARQQLVQDTITVIRRNPGILGRQTA